jgi:hypothetical protein
MKTARFLFTMAGFGALTVGLGLAGESSRQEPDQKKAIPAQHHNPDRPEPVPNRQEDSAEKRVDYPKTKRASVNDPHQPGLTKAATAAKKGSTMNKTGSASEPFPRLPIGRGTTALSTVVIRGRDPAPAIIGGLAPSGSKNSAAVINGTGIRRKP